MPRRPRLLGQRVLHAAGFCVPKRANGSSCTRDVECAFGFCTDGVCCSSRCDGQCEFCHGQNTAGTCTAVVGEPLPGRAACGAIKQRRFLHDGEVRRRRAPPVQPSEIQCGAYACESGRCKRSCTPRTSSEDCAPGAICQDGRCVQTERCDPSDCIPYACDGGACVTRCTSSLECAGGHNCTSKGACVRRADAGWFRLRVQRRHTADGAVGLVAAAHYSPWVHAAGGGAPDRLGSARGRDDRTRRGLGPGYYWTLDDDDVRQAARRGAELRTHDRVRSVADCLGHRLADGRACGSGARALLGGRFRVLRRIGEGGMGAVYEVVDPDGQPSRGQGHQRRDRREDHAARFPAAWLRTRIGSARSGASSAKLQRPEKFRVNTW